MGDFDSLADEELVRLGLDGDRAALDALFARHMGRLQRWVAAKMALSVRVRASVSDVLQDAFAGAWNGLERFEDRGPGSFAAWLDSITRNRLKDVLRKYYGHKKVFRPSAELPASIIALAQRGRPGEEAEAAELRAVLAEGLMQVTHDQRRAMRLVLGKGMTHAQAAQELGTTAEAIEKRIHRARKFLWAYLRRRWSDLE